MTDRPLFRITLRPLPGTDGWRELRLLLRTALRRYGLRCTAITTLGGNAPLFQETCQGDVANTRGHDCIDG